MEYNLAKKIAAWAHANRELNKQEDWIQFCMKRLRTLKYFKIFKSEIKKLKTYSGWCAFKGLSTDTTLMQIQSGRTVPLILLVFLQYIKTDKIILEREVKVGCEFVDFSISANWVAFQKAILRLEHENQAI
jgi:hypothetical protein